MRLVCHHLMKPAEIDASLFRSLKPTGLLGVIDEEPAPGTSIPEGVPKNRGGLGVPQKVLIDELTVAGFQVVTTRDDWPKHDAIHQTYCVVFRKPGPWAGGARHAARPYGQVKAADLRNTSALPFSHVDQRILNGLMTRWADEPISWAVACIL